MLVAPRHVSKKLGLRVGIRCNTHCEDCVRENGIIGCTATAQLLGKIPRLPEFMPDRREPEPKVRFAWTEITTSSLRALRGEAALQEPHSKGEGTKPRHRNEPVVATQTEPAFKI